MPGLVNKKNVGPNQSVYGENVEWSEETNLSPLETRPRELSTGILAPFISFCLHVDVMERP